MTDVTQNLLKLRRRIDCLCDRYGREPGSVNLLAVGKRQPVDSIRRLAGAGQHVFGENLLQEALEKQAELGDPGLSWHFIGRVQGNKTRDIANHFDWVHSVDREKVLRRLSDQRDSHRPPLNICLQVLLADEPAKTGISAKDLPALAELAAEMPGLLFRGLMCIPPPENEIAKQRAWFSTMRRLFDGLVARGHSLDTLSMGMSADLEAAIAEGATIVRVGTALFGPRPDAG